VTEPDPIAALAAQLEQLRGQIGSLRARHSEDYGHVMVLMLEVRKPGEKIDAAIARRQAGEPRRRTASACPATSTRSSPALCGSGPGRSPVSSSRRTWPRFPACWGGAPGGVLGAREPHGGVGPDLRRPGQPGPAGRPVVV